MALLKKSIVSIGALLLALAMIGLLLPSTLQVQRSIVIDSSRPTVFALLNDFHQVNKWSPWLDADPNARIEISGPRRGAGATVSWDGSVIGQGSQTITQSTPFERVLVTLEFRDQGKAAAEFNLDETDGGTVVIWKFTMDFGYRLISRYVGLIFGGSIGDDYENGLQNLKSMAEGLPRADFSDVEIEHLVVEAIDIAYLPTASLPESAAISNAMRKSYLGILRFIDGNSLYEAGAPISISRAFNGSEISFDAAIPVRGITESTPKIENQVRLGKTWAGPVIRVRHDGPYRNLYRTHEKIAAYIAALGIQRKGDAWESYVSDPTRTNEDELLTYVYYPIADPGSGNQPEFEEP